MASIERFEDMEVWRQARRTAGKIYADTGQGGFARDFGLRDQIRRAVVSMMSNIAEGFERGSNREFIQFLFIAKGSAGEVRAQLYLALDLGYIEKATFDQLNADLLSISRQLSGLIQYLKKNDSRLKIQDSRSSSRANKS
jgi:four helix bundle protein